MASGVDLDICCLSALRVRVPDRQEGSISLCACCQEHCLSAGKSKRVAPSCPLFVPPVSTQSGRALKVMLDCFKEWTLSTDTSDDDDGGETGSVPVSVVHVLCINSFDPDGSPAGRTALVHILKVRKLRHRGVK